MNTIFRYLLSVGYWNTNMYWKINWTSGLSPWSCSSSNIKINGNSIRGWDSKNVGLKDILMHINNTSFGWWLLRCTFVVFSSFSLSLLLFLELIYGTNILCTFFLLLFFFFFFSSSFFLLLVSSLVSLLSFSSPPFLIVLEWCSAAAARYVRCWLTRARTG